MFVFLACIAAGLTGLLLMALPGLAGHGHAGHAGGHVPHLPHLTGKAGTPAPTGIHASPMMGWLLPNPRAIFSVLTLFGAFGFAIRHSSSLSTGMSALAALLPALLVEKLVMAPVWNLLVGFSGKPSTPLESIMMEEACAVTPFRNGRGMVSVEKDGRALQLRADLTGKDASMPVRVGDRLRIEDVDSARERVTVSLL